MHACSGLARKSSAMHKPPLFSLLCFSEDCQSLRMCSLDVGECHRLEGIIIGCDLVSIGQKWIHRPPMDCRSALCAVDRQKVPAKSIWQQQRTELCMAMQFKQCMHQPYPLSCLWLKGTWSLVLGPSIAYFNAWWPKRPSYACWFQM